MSFAPINLIKVGNFLRSIGFEHLEINGELNVKIDDFLRLKQRLEELEMKKPEDDFEKLDNIPIVWSMDQDNERPKN